MSNPQCNHHFVRGNGDALYLFLFAELVVWKLHRWIVNGGLVPGKKLTVKAFYSVAAAQQRQRG